MILTNGENRAEYAERVLDVYKRQLLFVLVMASYYTISAWMQMNFGMYGLAMTELYLLLLSVGITVLCGADLA